MMSGSLCLKDRQEKAIYFDNFFSSVKLSRYLMAKFKLRSVGTIRKNRNDKCPLKTDEELTQEGRGYYDTKVKDGVQVIKWLDNKPVHVVSTLTGVEPLGNVERYDKKTKVRGQFPIPHAVQMYNRYMGGVDLHDMFAELYRTPYRGRRWYMTLITYMLDLSAINSWLIYRRDATMLKVKCDMNLKQFKLALSSSLRADSGKSTTGARIRSETIIKRPRSYRPSDTVRYDGHHHLPSFQNMQKRCKYCKMGHTKVLCVRCEHSAPEASVPSSHRGNSSQGLNDDDISCQNLSPSSSVVLSEAVDLCLKPKVPEVSIKNKLGIRRGPASMNQSMGLKEQQQFKTPTLRDVKCSKNSKSKPEQTIKEWFEEQDQLVYDYSSPPTTPATDNHANKPLFRKKLKLSTSKSRVGSTFQSEWDDQLDAGSSRYEFRTTSNQPLLYDSDSESEISLCDDQLESEISLCDDQLEWDPALLKDPLVPEMDAADESAGSEDDLSRYLMAKFKLRSVGTIRKNRNDKCPLKTDEELTQEGRGYYDTKVKDGVQVIKWLDNKPVHVVSTLTGVEPLGNVERYDKKTKVRGQFPIPHAVQMYNRYMGGVDLHDMFAELYRTPYRGRRWYMTLITYMLDLSAINSWLIYRRDATMLKVKCDMNLKQFKLALSSSLRADSGKSTTGARIRSETIIKRPRSYRPSDTVRYDGHHHLPSFQNMQKRCKYCKMGHTKVLCVRCEVSLCFVPTRQCFSKFHLKMDETETE
ncbi:hypothetical protein FOCC_FOCC014344 [Frankliniella occidentalis]|nr:hypothetical protein FOCC_FOCC014344 [Frankliniella occidentalis]